MVDLPFFDKDGKSAGTVSIDEKVFGDIVKKKLLRDIVVIYETNKRIGTVATKRRGEVEGSTRKPWKQKHTGRARAGTIRSPLWRKGGVVFGPQPREFRLDMPKKMRQGALDSALLGKIKDSEVKVIEGLEFAKPATKKMAAILRNIGISRKCLIGVANYKKEVWLSARNLPYIKMSPAKDFNAYDVLRNKELLLTKEALDWLVKSRKGDAVKEEAVART